MTVVYTYAASDNSRNRRKARRASQRDVEQASGKQPASRVTKACISVPARSSEKPSANNICLPEVAKFAAGFRNVREDCYHVIK
ncbi:hypothetical protein [Yersinia enterocolitica]|uniref:hypothetical protein n=1 Tax=Yersinia enterocolitica TaxID=630 RepID=UPI003D00792B